MTGVSQIVELRQYTLHPGARETLIELFDRELVETQEAVGMAVIGQFRDCDDPDRFVWLRGFPDMGARAEGLEAFYGGPVWAEHRDAANATMIDSDDVLLLRPARPASGFPPPARRRPPPATTGSAPGLVAVTICYLDERADEAFVGEFERDLRSVLAATGAQLLAYLVTKESPNNFPALPVRDETVFVWVARVPDGAAFERHREGLRRSAAWLDLLRHVEGEPELLKLSPTARSLL